MARCLAASRWLAAATTSEGEKMSLFCITNETPGVRSCRILGEHIPTCGSESCKGCAPRLAEHGLLCWGCWENLVNTYARWGEFTSLLDGVERAVQLDNAGVRSSGGGRIPLPLTWLAIDECNGFLGSLGETLDEWVAWTEGAKDAVRFTKAAHEAYRAHPIEESPHRLRKVRCTECSELALVWFPPAFFGDDVRVACTQCSHEIDQHGFEMIAAIESRVS